MKKKQFNIWIISCLTILLALAFVVWPSFRTAAQKADKPASTEKRSKNDHPDIKSSSKRSGSKISEVDMQAIDEAMREVQKAMEKLQKEDFVKVQAEIQKAMREIDTEKITREVARAMKEVDMEKISHDIEKAMKEIDAANISKQVRMAMDEIDIPALQKEIAIEMKKLQVELKDVHVNVQKEMEKAKVELKKARVQLELMREGLHQLEADGLIKKGEKVNIEYKEGILYLNGQPQSKAISEKYEKYFSGNKGSIHLEMNDDDNSRIAK